MEVEAKVLLTREHFENLMMDLAPLKADVVVREDTYYKPKDIPLEDFLKQKSVCRVSQQTTLSFAEELPRCALISTFKQKCLDMQGMEFNDEHEDCKHLDQEFLLEAFEKKDTELHDEGYESYFNKLKVKKTWTEKVKVDGEEYRLNVELERVLFEEIDMDVQLQNWILSQPTELYALEVEAVGQKDSSSKAVKAYFESKGFTEKDFEKRSWYELFEANNP